MSIAEALAAPIRAEPDRETLARLLATAPS